MCPRCASFPQSCCSWNNRRDQQRQWSKSQRAPAALLTPAAVGLSCETTPAGSWTTKNPRRHPFPGCRLVFGQTWWCKTAKRWVHSQCWCLICKQNKKVARSEEHWEMLLFLPLWPWIIDKSGLQKMDDERRMNEWTLFWTESRKSNAIYWHHREKHMKHNQGIMATAPLRDAAKPFTWRY